MSWKEQVDCFFYLQGNCSRATCRYRHSSSSTDAAKVSGDIEHNKDIVAFSDTSKKERMSHDVDIPFTFTSSASDAVSSEFKSVELSGKPIPQGISEGRKGIMVCRYHLHGKCKKGGACTYLHTSNKSDHNNAVKTDPLSALSTENSMVCTPSNGILKEESIGEKRKGKDILDKYSFRKNIKVSKTEVVEENETESDPSISKN